MKPTSYFSQKLKADQESVKQLLSRGGGEKENNMRPNSDVHTALQHSAPLSFRKTFNICLVEEYQGEKATTLAWNRETGRERGMI